MTKMGVLKINDINSRQFLGIVDDEYVSFDSS